MAKDYFEKPAAPSRAVPVRSTRVPIQSVRPPQVPVPEPVKHEDVVSEPEEHEDDVESSFTQAQEKSIRNIRVPAVRPRPRPVNSAPEDDYGAPPRPRGNRNVALWVVAAASLVAVGGFAVLAIQPTTITLTPHTQVIAFDQSSKFFTVYPLATAPTGALAYTLQSVDFDDSEVVPTSGTEHAETKASGQVNVYNAFSPDPVKLIKNTRFAAPSGQVFRVPADVVVPGKVGSTPGKVTVMVIADAVGDSYNVPAADHWTLPGLKSNAVMFKGVYASSDAAMSGGFSGDRPGFAPGALDAAIAKIRGRLADKAQAALLSAASSSTIALPGLLGITYESLPQTQEAGGGARIHERAHVKIPLISRDSLAQVIAGDSGLEQGADVQFVFSKDFSTALTAASAPIGDQPFQFTMSGSVNLVWTIDETALTQALAGRDKGAFQTIVTGFPSIQEAKARVQPLWSSHFPVKPTEIKVDITDVTAPRS